MAPTVYMNDSPGPLPHFSDAHPLEDRLGGASETLGAEDLAHRLCQKLQTEMGQAVEECGLSAGEGDHPPLRGSLLHITLRTLVLLRRNQQLQHKLSRLQAETHAFVESVLTAPAAGATPSSSPNHH